MKRDIKKMNVSLFWLFSTIIQKKFIDLIFSQKDLYRNFENKKRYFFEKNTTYS